MCEKENLSTIAKLIRSDWKNIYFGARPYLDAMECLQTTADNYGEDSGKSIVQYFLANAQSWRGDTARAVKAKLNEMLKMDTRQPQADGKLQKNR